MVDRSVRWGDLQSESEESESEDEDDLAAEEPTETVPGDQSGLASMAGLVSSLATGLLTPSAGVDVRKGVDSVETSQQPLYHVLQQKSVNVGRQEKMGSDHVYLMPGQQGLAGGKVAPGGTVSR